MKRPVVLAAVVLLCPPAAIRSSALAAGSPGSAPAHYIVFALDDAGVPQPQSHRLVQLAVPRASLTEVELTTGARVTPPLDEWVTVRLLDARGAVVFRDLVSVPRWVRTELGLGGPFGAGASEETLAPVRPRAFVVRIPVWPTSRLQLGVAERMEAGSTWIERRYEFEPDALAADPSLPLANLAPPPGPVPPAAPASANRVDLLVMGDGFTAGQSASFQAQAASAVAGFFGAAPYAAYQNYFLTATLFTASTQQGADHPPYNPSCSTSLLCCSDSTAQSDPLSGTYVATAFDASFCGFPSAHRLLTVNAAKVMTAAAAYPDWDAILVVVNDTTYGGSGGRVAAISAHPSAPDLARHEFGHSFSRLSDEYSIPYPGFPACSDLTGPACEPNATDQTSRSLIKWVPWVSPSTPIPTPDAAPYNGLVGLFQGARYQATGMYRPWRNCLMRSLGVGFCPVCAQAFVLRLYAGGWGSPAAGIDTIEPGSENPAPGSVSMTYPGSRSFSAGLLQPVGGPPLGVTWLVDGVAQPGATGSSYSFTPPAPGLYSIQLVTVDVTPLVHPSLRPPSLWRSRTWTVAVSPLADLSVTVRDDGPAREGQPLTYAVVASNAGPDAAAGATVADLLPPQLTGVSWTCTATAGSSCPASGSGSLAASVTLAAGGSVTFTLIGTVATAGARQIVNSATVSPPPGLADPNHANDSASVTTPVYRTLGFYTVPPCRVLDTRAGDAPALAASASRTFTLAGKCGIPASAWAVSVNLTATQPSSAGNLRLYAAGTPAPLASVLNYSAGQTRANNAMLPLDANGRMDVRCSQASGTVHLILDVNGYLE